MTAKGYVYLAGPARLRPLLGGADVVLSATPPADTFVLGTTQPQGGVNVGCRIPDAQLTSYAGSLTNVAAGQTVSGLAITGNIEPTASNTTYRDCVILMGATPYATGTDYGAWRGYQPAITGGLAEFVTVRPSAPTVDHYGPVGAGFTFRRCEISGVVDGLHINGISATTMFMRLEASHLHDFPTYAVDPRQGGGASHSDSIQAAGLLDLEIVGNTIDGASSASILIQQNAGVYAKVFINSNWINGLSTGGSAFNVSENSRGPVNNLTLTNNKFGGKTYSQIPGTTIDAATTVISGNIIAATGAAMTFTRI